MKFSENTDRFKQPFGLLNDLKSVDQASYWYSDNLYLSQIADVLSKSEQAALKDLQLRPTPKYINRCLYDESTVASVMISKSCQMVTLTNVRVPY
ncbi:hypothetical protein O9929_13195 [Vibrio lentus]|nr:hypothetical protein [Vibrio lentus]